MKASLAAVSLIVLAATAAPCQTVVGPSTFEVASVKPDDSDTGVDRISISKGDLIIRNVSLKRLIAMAHGIPESREYLLSGPEWLDSERFDISARYPPETPNTDVLVMLQSLLAERFHMAIHRELRQFSGYALLIGKGGPKLHSAASPRPSAMFRALAGHASGSSASMPDLADRLSRPPFELERPVVDFTALPGRFDLTLDWSPTDKQGENGIGPSLFTALEEQLGLRLEPRKLPLEVLVVDRANKVPAEN
jgi:uncharacterized protein (TIGR03435 family)